MRPLIVVTELRQLPPEERWSKLVAPLQHELLTSGLGEILDSETLRRQVDDTGTCLADEVALALEPAGFTHGYARDLIDRVLSLAGVRSEHKVVARRWRSFGCEEYFAEGWAVRGHFDEFSQTAVIIPLTEVFEDVEPQFLVVGHSGCDGIDFGYRRDRPGLWAYYPLRREFKAMAPTLAELVDGWCSGALSV